MQFLATAVIVKKFKNIYPKPPELEMEGEGGCGFKFRDTVPLNGVSILCLDPPRCKEKRRTLLHVNPGTDVTVACKVLYCPFYFKDMLRIY
jgi:hypothetical protein